MMQQSEADDQHKRVEHQKLESMLGLAELTTCRRVALLDYFGEPGHDPCGNCDNCLTPPVTWDGTTAAQKALSCVYRTGQRFGVNYVIDVLSGKQNDRIERFGHHQLSTFGIGSELSATEWRSVFRQLIARGFLWADVEHYSSLRLTNAARPVLRGEQTLELRRSIKPQKRSSRKRRDSAPPVVDNIPVDALLWDALRACRSALALESGVPPYVVFHDKTLRDMAHAMPETTAAMAEISGVGKTKLELYGSAFLDVIRDHLASTTTG
nr:HRDC domain-containing protein [Gammaproteobacteria bacterium]